MASSDPTFARVASFKLLTIVGCVGTLVFLGLEANREHRGGDWRRYQEEYGASLDPTLAAGFEPGIKQAFVPALGAVDRCQSCHVGIDDPTMADAEQPLASHPGEVLGMHPPDEFGCTVCHQGQGRAVEREAAHGEVAHWEWPLLRGELVYTSCGGCHAENGLYGASQALVTGGGGPGELLASELTSNIPHGELLARGKELVATRGCLGCHAYRGRGGNAGPDLTAIGDKGIHGYDFSHLPAGAERTPLAWLTAHFIDPGAVSPGTVMPGIGASQEDARALSAYMLSLKTVDVPARYRPPVGATRGEPASGRELYELFCVSCHGVGLEGGDVPEIRTPSLSNEGFLSVADRPYLAHIIANGRSGTEMPAWHAGAGGLTEDQIERLVDYVLSHAPDRADVRDVSRRRGVARYGAAIYRGNCASCHGLSGEGGIGTSLASQDFLSLASDDFLIRTILDGRRGTGMPSWRNLDAQQVSDLVAFVRTWERERPDVEQALAHLAGGDVDLEIGARLYEARCADCHGDDGEGSIGPAVQNPAFLRVASDRFLVRAILEGRPGTAMPAWADLSSRDVADLVGWMRANGGVERAEPARPVAQGDPGNGALLFERTCVSCHGPDAVGGSAPQLRNRVFLETASDALLFETISHGRPGTPMRGFLKSAERSGGGIGELTSSQIADLVTWLRRLEHAEASAERPFSSLGNTVRGRELYEGEASCAKCHGFDGEGGVGPAIGNPEFLRVASDGYLLGTMVLGRDGTEMRKFVSGGITNLDAMELMDVAAYVRSLETRAPRGRAGWRKYHVTDDQIEFGRELYAGNCGACHGVEGRGGYAPELNNPEFLEAASDGFLAATIARGREGTPMRPFGAGHASLAVLEHGEIRALVGYLRSFERAVAGPTPNTTPPSPNR